MGVITYKWGMNKIPIPAVKTYLVYNQFNETEHVMKKLSMIFAMILWSFSFGQIQQVDIISEGVQVNAYFYKAKGEDLKPTVIWMHGLPGRKETGTLPLANSLNDLNINVLAFDYRGLWNNQGIFTVANSQTDLNNVINFVYNPDNIYKYSIDTTKIIVAGHSYGSAMATISGIYNEKVKDIILLGLADLSYIIRKSYNSEDIDNRATVQSFKDNLWGAGNLINNFDEFITDLTYNNYRYDFIVNAEKLLDNRMLIIVSYNDHTVPIENHFFPLYRKLLELKHHDLEVMITKHDHNFIDFRKNELPALISKWIRK